MQTGQGAGRPSAAPMRCTEREFFVGNLLVRIHFIIVMIRWTGLRCRQAKELTLLRMLTAVIGRQTTDLDQGASSLFFTTRMPRVE